MRKYRLSGVIPVMVLILVILYSVGVVYRFWRPPHDEAESLAASLKAAPEAAQVETERAGEVMVVPVTGDEINHYLPLVVVQPSAGAPVDAGGALRVNAPYFDGEVIYPETAVFWFGKVNRDDNFTDVRIGYSDEHLFINLAVFDRTLWYDPDASAGQFDKWDSASVYLQAGDGAAQDEAVYRFDAMLNWWEKRDGFQAAFEAISTGWQAAGIPFATSSGWRGNAPNDNSRDDRGWVAAFRIPFKSLGLNGPPSQGSVWRLGVRVYDRDELGDPRVLESAWPPGLDDSRQDTWGELRFGMPAFTRPQSSIAGETRIRHKLNGAYVPGGEVGGRTNCGDGLSFWSEWGDASYVGDENNATLNVQNQSDVADWPCFSKYYLTFPLEAVPAGKVILSARLTLHQMGNSGGGEWGVPESSYIQLFTIAEDWKEGELTWNNAPLARENVSGAWVDPISTFPGWPGVPWVWDVSRAVAEAYQNGQPLRLAIYSADGAYHSGKYFVSSYTGDWNARGRPALDVAWGEP